MKRKIHSIFTHFACAIAISIFGCLAAHAEEAALPQLKITYNASQLNYETYIVGTMELTDIDGTVTALPTQFKTRGATARQYSMKPALNMKLRDAEGNELDTNLLGLRKASSFILDAMAIDRINMRNRVAFDIWNDFSRLPYETDFDGRNGTVGKFVEMYINGEYKGIYCLSDKINRKLLDLKKPELDEETGDVTIRGLLYKHGTNDIGDQNTPGFFNDYLVYVIKSKDAWELHEPEEYASEEAWAPLTELYANDNYRNYDYVKEHFWLENLADYTVHLMALSIQDNWGNKNKYFSIQNVTKAGDKSKFVVTPWDLDCSLGGRYDGGYYDGNYSKWAVSDIAKNAPLPFSACLAQQEFKALLKARWIEGRANSLSVESVTKRLLDYCDLFEDSGAWQRTVDYWKTQKYSEQYVEDLRKEVLLVCDWYKARFKEMDEYFNVTEEDLNAVETIGVDEERPDEIYTLQGIRVREITAPGIFIVNGRKVVRR